MMMRLAVALALAYLLPIIIDAVTAWNDSGIVFLGYE